MRKVHDKLASQSVKYCYQFKGEFKGHTKIGNQESKRHLLMLSGKHPEGNNQLHSKDKIKFHF